MTEQTMAARAALSRMAPVPLPATAARMPMTGEEAAALASRMRVEARLPLIVIVGGALGIVCGVTAMWPFFTASDQMVGALLATSRGRVIAGVMLAIPLLLAGALPLLAFYSFRLQYQAGRSTPGAIEDNLLKIRRILAAAMLLALAAFAVGLSRDRDWGAYGLAALYVMCFAACAILVGHVRKALGEFETADERARRRMARGFAVEVRPPAHSSIPGTADAPAAPVEALRIETAMAGEAAPDLLPASPAAALPVSALPVSALLAPGLPLATEAGHAGQAERDLRAILHLMACVGIGVYLLRMPGAVQALEPALRSFPSRIYTLLFPAAGTSKAQTCLALATVCQGVLTVCGVFWVLWGVACLSFGARLRGVVTALAWASLVLAAAPILLMFLATYLEQNGGGGPNIYRRRRFELFYGSAFVTRPAEIVHAAVMVGLLTRRRVRDLFHRGSEAGEAE